MHKIVLSKEDKSKSENRKMKPTPTQKHEILWQTRQTFNIVHGAWTNLLPQKWQRYGLKTYMFVTFSQRFQTTQWYCAIEQTMHTLCTLLYFNNVCLAAHRKQIIYLSTTIWKTTTATSLCVLCGKLLYRFWDAYTIIYPTTTESKAI